MWDPRPSKAHPESRAVRKELEAAHGYENLKSMGLKAGVLALMAGIALYPKISAEADIIEKEQRWKQEKKEIFKKRRREQQDDDNRRMGGRGGSRSVGGGGVRGGDFDDRDYSRRGSEGGSGGKVRFVGGSDGGSLRGDRDGGKGYYKVEKRDRSKDLMRVDEYDMRRGEGSHYKPSKRRRSMDDIGDSNRRWEQASMRPPAGSQRTRDWVDANYEYLNENDYHERDRRRW